MLAGDVGGSRSEGPTPECWRRGRAPSSLTSFTRPFPLPLRFRSVGCGVYGCMGVWVYVCMVVWVYGVGFRAYRCRVYGCMMYWCRV